MRKLVLTTGAAVALALAAEMGAPDTAAAATATGSVCQFYRGDPLCKTVETTSCVGANAGLEARVCTKETEYWYWS